MSKRSVDLCSFHEIRWCGASAHRIEGKDSRYKIFWVGNEKGTCGLGILLSEEWIEKVCDFNRVSDRTIMIKLAIDNKIITILSFYAPQVSLENIIKDIFYDPLHDNGRKVGADETLVIRAD